MGSMIRAKWHCESVTKNDYHQEIVRFRAAFGPGNEDWSKATPGGTLEMTISNEAAHGKFIPGQDYFSDFNPASA